MFLFDYSWCPSCHVMTTLPFQVSCPFLLWTCKRRQYRTWWLYYTTSSCRPRGSCPVCPGLHTVWVYLSKSIVVAYVNTSSWSLLIKYLYTKWSECTLRVYWEDIDHAWIVVYEMKMQSLTLWIWGPSNWLQPQLTIEDTQTDLKHVNHIIVVLSTQQYYLNSI